MSAPGPPIEALTRRLIDTPGDFLADPGDVAVPAVVGDLFGAPLAADQVAELRAGERTWLRCVLVASWLLAGLPADPPAAWRFMAEDLRVLSGHVPADALVDDPDHREELARRALRALDLLPAGETEAQAADRLSALDSVERARVLEATRAAERRAAEVRAAMHAQAAAEAAAKASRE